MQAPTRVANNLTLWGLALLSGLVLGQTRSNLAHGADPTPTPVPTLEQTQRLERYRRIIENVEDSDTTRIAQAEELLLTGWPRATEIAVSFLQANEEPPAGNTSTKTIVCQAIGIVGLAHPQRLSHDLVGPLLDLLTSPSETVATHAGTALAAFPDGDVVHAISALVADSQAPMNQRLAAVSALLPNMDRREVVAALISCLAALDANEDALTSRIVLALARVSDKNHGNDIDAWKRWWHQQAALSETQWLRAQVRHMMRHVAQAGDRLNQARQENARRCDELSGRLSEILASTYRLTLQAEQKDELLVAWFADSTVEFRRVAASLVAEQISEGNLPTQAVRAALRERFNDESPDVRKLAFDIVGALNEPADAEAMLARLATEQDEQVRETILRVLGKLRNPAAIPTLVAEFERQGVSARSLAAAADALGMLAGRGQVEPDVVESLVGPLKSRFADTNDDARDVKVAILGAMAAIGSADFKTEFEANLAADDPELLLRAIQGIAVVGNGAELDRLANLLVHSDARVRQRAMAAVGVLGSEEQLSVVIPRLNPSVEPIDGPRVAAWQALLQISERMPIAAQVGVAERLSDIPALAIDYLSNLHERLVTVKPNPPELSLVREKLARGCHALDRHTEALPYWRQLHAAAAGANDPRVGEFAAELLNCALACDRIDQIDEVLDSLAGAATEPKQAAQAALIAYVKKIADTSDDARLQEILNKLEPLAVETWPVLSEYLRSRPSGDKVAPTTTQPSDADS